MNIPSSISPIHRQATIPSATGSVKTDAGEAVKGFRAKSALNVSSNVAFGVEFRDDNIDLSKESFGKLGELFDKAFNFPAPPMPKFPEEG